MQFKRLTSLAAAVSVGLLCSASYAHAEPSKKGHAYAPDRILIKFKKNASSAEISARANQYNLNKGKALGKGKNAIAIYHLNKNSSSIPQLVEMLNKSPFVEYAEPDYALHISALPSDVQFSSQWGLHNTGQTGGTFDADIDAPEAWDFNIDASQQVIAVVDSGVDYNHNDLSSNMWINPGEIPNDGIDNDANGYVDDIYGIDTANNDADPMDDNNHGTHVAGIIGASGNNSIGVSGVNWNVQIMALKFMDAGGGGFTSDAVELIDYMVQMKQNYGINIVAANHSWGGGAYSQAMFDALSAADSAGIINVAAAGNSTSNNDVIADYPSNYAIPSLISVAATNHRDNLASFSNYGATEVDLAAPGEAILSTVVGGVYSTFSGTSMAAPFVAGSVAQLAAQNPSRTAMDIRSLLLNSVDQLASLEGLVATAGRLNLHSALSCTPGNPTVILNVDNLFDSETANSYPLTAQLNDCGPIIADSAGITVMDSNGISQTIAMVDDGSGDDLTANDGIFTTSWQPQIAGLHTLTFELTHNGMAYQNIAESNTTLFQGYLSDNSEPYNWNDIALTGTPLALGDDANAAITLPFAVDFYEQSNNTLYINSNGVLGFTPTVADFNNDLIPAANGVGTFIAPLWDDFNPQNGGQILWEVIGTAPSRQLIVQYENVPLFDAPNPSDGMSFQVIIAEDSTDIVFQYKDTLTSTASDNGASASIGLQRDDAYGQQFSVNQASITSMSAIRWVKYSPTTVLPAVPDVKVNNIDGQITLASTDIATLTLSLDSQGNPNPGEYWVGVMTPTGTYWLDANSSLIKSTTPIAHYQGPLLDLPTTTLYQGNLPWVGPYTYFLVVDMIPNGILDDLSNYDLSFIAIH